MGGCRGEKQGDEQWEEGGLGATGSGFSTGHVLARFLGPSHTPGAGRAGQGPGRGAQCCPHHAGCDRGLHRLMWGVVSLFHSQDTARSPL